MGLLSGLFENETLKNAAFKLLKKHMVENDCRFIVIKLDDQGEFDLQTFQDVTQPVVMSQKSLDQLMQIALDQERIVTELTEERDSIAAIKESLLVAKRDRDGMLKIVQTVTADRDYWKAQAEGMNIINKSTMQDGADNTDPADAS
jgi:hypothetical protein